jgi:hypothetical protein
MCVYRLGPSNQVADEAFNIAWGFLRDCVSEPLPVQSFLADVIDRQIAKGDRSRIRVANKAIMYFEAKQ